jgi:hypothetical protein
VISARGLVHEGQPSRARVARVANA